MARLTHIVRAKMKKELRKEIKAKNQAYYERNQLVAALTKFFPSYMSMHDPEDKKWDKKWMNIVFIDLPTGQASWHIHDDELEYFAHVPHMNVKWDGHTTEEKYERLRNI